MSAYLDVALCERQLLACGHQQLRLDQVDAGDHLGDRVFDLDTRVHLDEVELVILVQELEGAGAAIAHGAAGIDAAFAHLLALLGRQARGRCFFDDLLVAALHRAVALTQVHHVAVVVADDLKLDVPRLLEKLFHVDGAVAKGGQRLLLGHGDGIEQCGFGMHHAHAASTTAARGLDDDRVADVAGDLDVEVGIGAQRTVRAGHAGHAGFFHGAYGRDLVTHQADGLGLGADEYKAALFDAFGKVGVLGQKAIAGVDGHRVGDLGGTDDGRHVQVAQRRGRRPYAHRLVGQQHVLEVVVGRGVHGDSLDVEFATGPQDAQGNFAAIGDNDFVEHGCSAPAYSTTNSGWPNSTGSPFLTMMAVTRPPRSASIWFIIFMASMMHST